MMTTTLDNLPDVQVGASTSLDRWERPDPDIRTRFSRIPTANIGDAMHRLGVVASGIKPVWPGAALVGAAYTVWTRPGDNLGIHEAMRRAEPGDVLVINGGGDESRALIGELMGGRAKSLGIVGFIIDGAIRDASGLAEYEMPVFARAATGAGPYKFGPYALQTPVALGGVVVNPGDVVVADADGVVIVPLAQANLVADRAEAKQADELRIRQGVDNDINASPYRER
jgi:regulator of RNase E activity RraA